MASLTCAGGVLTLQLPDGSAPLKCVLPSNPGIPGRDGISIKGDPGVPGPQGAPGVAGRDSTVPGPTGPSGGIGRPGPCPIISIGNVTSGDHASCSLGGPPENLTLNLVIPKGPPGRDGRAGTDGKHGNSDYCQVMSLGNSPIYTRDFLGKYVIADGVITLPTMTAAEVGMFVQFKTLTSLCLLGAVEGNIDLSRNQSKRFIVIPYNGSYCFTSF